MTKTLSTLTAEALRMPDSDRGELATRLLDSLDPETETGTDEAWAQEIASRLDDVRSGRVTPVPWAEARQQILADDDHAG